MVRRNVRTACLSSLMSLCFASGSLAYTLDTTNKIASTNGSQSDVQSAVSAAGVTDGWTVTIPGGSFSWSSTVTVSKGIAIRGAGVGVTTISGSGTPKLSLTKQTTHVIDISGMTFSVPGGEAIAATGSWTARPFIIHDCEFNLSGGRAIRVQTNGGLIYKCTFNGSFNFNDEAVQHKNASDTQSWSSAETMGTNDSTGERNLYVEDCVFNSMPLQAFDFDDAARIVVRRSQFVNSAITSHGADTSPQGVRHFEVYDNTFEYTYASNDPNAVDVGYFMYIRGGTGIIADNVIDNIVSQQWGNKSEIQLTVFNITRNGGQVPCQTSYPAFHQVGRGNSGSDPMRIWGNTGAGNYNSPGLVQYSPDDCGNGQQLSTYLQVNRDYFVSSMRPGYQKYAYPHPLRSGTTGNPGTPLPPQGLRIVSGGN